MSSKSVHDVFSYPAHRHTDRWTYSIALPFRSSNKREKTKKCVGLLPTSVTDERPRAMKPLKITLHDCINTSPRFTGLDREWQVRRDVLASWLQTEINKRSRSGLEPVVCAIHFSGYVGRAISKAGRCLTT